MMPTTVLTIDDAASFGGLLGPDIRTQALPLAAQSSLSGVRDRLSARSRDGRLHAGEGGRAVDAIGLNANLLVRGSQGSGRRTDANGMRLLEWLRKDLRLTTPVVLWSFLDFDSLRAKHPILTLTKGVTFLRLPLSLAQLQAAFEQALSPENALSPELLGQELARLYGDLSGGIRVPAEMAERVGLLATSYRSLDEPLRAALDALADGSAETLLEALNQPGWRDFKCTARDLERELRRERLQVAELVEVGKRARGLSSFAQWHGAARRSTQELAEAAPYYADCAAILRVNVAALACAIDAEAER